ncbi:hypothetical protein [Paraburkholderia sp. 32]|uniref:SLOG domain-containing protein n=1 Tax=Paraburkholderia sp. 32 TaxID=2991057 RepID=UPI003D1CC130
MNGAIFLSAGVPDPRRGPEFAATADTVAITAAVSALVHVTLGRRLLIWGGQPAITPMIWVVAESLGVDYAAWVRLYQSSHFRDEYPEDNERFSNVVYTEDIEGDRNRSLLHMRERIFGENQFDAAVFIGGMGGIVDEFHLLQQVQPLVQMIPVATTGGAVLNVAKELPGLSEDLHQDFDYVSLFHRHLQISVKERRYERPGLQPESVADRLY